MLKKSQLPDNFNINNVNIVYSKQIANEFNSFLVYNTLVLN